MSGQRARLTVDPALIERARAGDREAFGAVVLSLGTRLFRTARLILRDMDRAEDAVQDCLITAWRELPRLRDTSRFEAWLWRSLMHACFDEARRERRKMGLHAIADLHVDDRSANVALREELDRAFRRLPVEQRAVLVLQHYIGLSVAEIAETTGVPLGTVKSRLFYASQAMRAAIEADDRQEIAASGDRWA